MLRGRSWKAGETRLQSVARAVASIALLVSTPAAAITGGSPASQDVSGRSALIVSTRGAACSSAVLTNDLLLTAAHCVGPTSDYAVVVFEEAGARLISITNIVLHPRYSAAAFENRQPTPDMALVELAEKLPSTFRPAQLARDVFRPSVDDRFLLTGFGMTDDADPKSAGRLFSVELPVIGNTVDATGVIMMRLSAGDDKVVGACDGDSGGPVYRHDEVVAVIGWRKSSGGRHCGTVTGATLVAPQLDWIAGTSEALGNTLSPAPPRCNDSAAVRAKDGPGRREPRPVSVCRRTLQSRSAPGH